MANAAYFAMQRKNENAELYPLKKIVWIIVLMIGGITSVNAQDNAGKFLLYANKINTGIRILPSAEKILPGEYFKKNGFHLHSVTRPSVRVSALEPEGFSGDFYYANCCGFFCKMEWVTQQKLHIPLSFRLGSLEYVNKLEGKE